MKPSLSLMFLALLLLPWAQELATGRRAPGVMLRSRCDAAGCDAAGAALGACGSSEEYQKVKPEPESPWILAYVPIRRCHRVLKDKSGEFSPPVYHGDTHLNFWCNWTIWAGSRKHIIIYIQGFITEEGCNKNEDKILFEGVSSLAENSVVYACWKKEMHVFATFAQAVHVVLLKRYLPNCRDVQFRGKYYIFQDQESESFSKDDVISETPAPKLPKQDSIFQSGCAENLRDVLGLASTPRSTMSPGKTTVQSSELVRGREITLGAMAVGSSVELVPGERARTPLLETKAACVLGAEVPRGLSCCEEAQGRGMPEGTLPPAAEGTWGQSLSVSGHITVGFGYTSRLSSVLLETALLSALQVAEPFLQPASMVLEIGQSALHHTPRLKDVSDLQFAIKPTRSCCLDLAAHLQSLSPSRRESKESADTIAYRGLGIVSLEKDESHPQPSVPADGTASGDADGLAEGLVPSLSSPYEVVNRDHSHLLPERSQRCKSSFRDLSMTQPKLGTNGLQYTKLVDVPSLESFRVVRGKAALHPTAPWDFLQKHPHLHGQSSHVLQSAPIDLGTLPQNAQAHKCPFAEKVHVSSLAVETCHHPGDGAVQPGLAASPSPTGPEHPPAAMSPPGTEAIPALVVSCTAPVPAAFGSAGLIPEAPLYPEVEPVSKGVSSLPAALDPVSLGQRAGISPASPGGQEMVLPAPPGHPSAASELGTDGSPRCPGPGVEKLALGEAGGWQGETSPPVGLKTRGPSPTSITVPKLGVGLPWPEDWASSGLGVATALLPSRRGEQVVPVQHQGTAVSNKLASDSNLRGFKMQKTTEALCLGGGEQRNASSSSTPVQPGPPTALWGEAPTRVRKPQEPADVSRNTLPGGQQQEHAELGPPWAVEYLPVRSCHRVLQEGSGLFYLPLHADIQTNIWCNWTIWAGPQKHIVIYVQGFQGSDGCSKNQDKIIFQGVSSSVETKVVYACHNQGTLIFATQATAVHVLFLSGSSSLSHQYRHFRGQYYVFRASETVGFSNGTIAPREPVQETSKEAGWRTAGTKGLVSVPRASPGPSAAPAELVSPGEGAQHPPHPREDALSSANPSEHGQLQDETKLERSLKGGCTEGRDTRDDVLVEPAPARQDAGRKAGPSALEIAKGAAEPVPALVTIAPRCSVGASSSEVASSSVSVSARPPSLDQASSSLSEVVAAACSTQVLVLEEPPLNMSTKPSPYSSPGVTAGDPVSGGERTAELFDLVSVLASLENDTVLPSQHHPGDVLFEVTIEIKPKDWIPRGGSELQKSLLEFMKNHIQENLKLSANRVNEIKFKEIKRTSEANLLLTFWLHLKPEERNMSLLLHSQLEEMLGTLVGAEKLQLVSLFVEDVNECSVGAGLCGEEAECFNGVGTYLCRCKKDYEDRSPTKSGTLCVLSPRSGISFFLRHADILVGAAIAAALAMLVAAGALCRMPRWGWRPRRTPSPEEPPVGAAEEPAMELHDLGECLRLDPFQLKLRARPPEWLWAARAHPGQAYRVFLEQSPPL